MCNVRCMIPDSLKVIDRMKIQGNLSCLCCIHLTLGKLDQIIPKTTLVLVDQVFLTLNFVIFILLIIIQKVHCPVDILTQLLGHSVHCTVALTDSKCRIVDQTFLKEIEVCLILQFLSTVFDQITYQFLKLRNKWEQNHNCCHTEYGIQSCNGYRSHDYIHKFEMNDCIDCVKDHGPQNQTKQVIHQVDQCCSLAILIRSNRRDQNRTGRTDTDTKYNRKCTCKSQDTSYRKCLQYTNCR